jgi:hypothetical protein
MDLLHFVGSRKTRSKKARLQLPNLPCEYQLRASDFSLNKHHIPWLELGQWPFWEDALYESQKGRKQNLRSTIICRFRNTFA